MSVMWTALIAIGAGVVGFSVGVFVAVLVLDDGDDEEGEVCPVCQRRRRPEYRLEEE